jgi:NAD(P)-dependent dehydrogenase (short-subunit alcohol dehydrogenase family)
MEVLRKYSNYIYYGLGLLSLTLLKKYFNGPISKHRKRMDGKVIIITGASDGIGKQTALELLSDGAEVILACRDEKKTIEFISSIVSESDRKRAHYVNLDLASFSSVRKFVADVKSRFDKVDILINNAGIWTDNNFRLTEDNIEITLQTNVLSHMVLTQELLPLLEKSQGRVLNVSSSLHSKCYKEKSFYESVDINDNEKVKQNYKGYNSYAFTKLGNIYFTNYLKEYLDRNKLKIKTASVHPGFVRNVLTMKHTTLVKSLIFLFYPILWFISKSLYRGAQTTLHLCYIRDEEFISGANYSDCKAEELGSFAKNTEIRNAAIELFKNYINTKGSVAGVKFNI